MSRGFLMFAHNNPEVDYGLMALCNALMIKTNVVDAKVALVTDEGTIAWLKQSRTSEMVSRAFDYIIINEISTCDQIKRFRDTQYTSYDLPWHNGNRASAYDLSPFEETIVLDTDYLIADGVMNSVWDSSFDIRMNTSAITLNHDQVPVAEQFLEPFGVPMYWATCVYFRKGEFAKTFFDLVNVIRENYDYYQYLYRFPGKLFRNDYAFSIAAHILSGWTDNDIIGNLPHSTILTSFDQDELLDVPAKNEFLFLIEDANDTWKYRPGRIDGISVHVMNKFSLIRNANRIIEIYGDK